MNFNTLQLAEPLLHALADLGFSEMTPIQQQAVPILLNGSDLLACAPTGTGKTIAFLLPLLNRLIQRKGTDGVRGVILAPTRELAIQIGRETEKLTRHSDLRHAVFIGGESIDEQIYLTERSLDLIIATPGRLNHLLQERIVKLSSLQVLVIDEGDRLLDMGFIGVVRKIVRFLPGRYQTSLFSATLMSDTEELARELLHKPKRIDLATTKPDLSLISQSTYYVDKQNKFNLLKHLLEELNIESALIFVRTKYDAEKVASRLQEKGFSAQALHGDKEQFDRQIVFRDFVSKTTKILVATDLAARGIDIPALQWIINYELPNEPETYIHRIGRTGRAGACGNAISLCDNAELRFLKPIRQLVGKKSMTIIEQHPFSYAAREKGEARNSAASIGKMKEKE